MTRSILFTLALMLTTTAARGDGLLFTFEGDMLPGDPGSDIIIANACESDCSRRLEDGHFLLEWGVMGDLVNYSHTIADIGETPPYAVA